MVHSVLVQMKGKLKIFSKQQQFKNSYLFYNILFYSISQTNENNETSSNSCLKFPTNFPLPMFIPSHLAAAYNSNFKGNKVLMILVK